MVNWEWYKNFTINVNNVNEVPVITSNGGGVTTAIDVAENTTAVTTVVATDEDTSDVMSYSITGGLDQSHFKINSITGELEFLASPDYENPTDVDTNNTYVVQVTVTDNGTGALTDIQTITITVTDVNETILVDILTQIGNEADDPDNINSVVTVAQLNQILPVLTNVVIGNEIAYQDYIDANPNLFGNPATQTEVQVMVDAVNAEIINKDALEKIKAYAEDSSNLVPTVEDYTNAGVTGVDVNNLSAVNKAVDVVTENEVDTVAKIQALVDGILDGNSTSAKVSIYRLYNTKTGVHLYTRGEADREHILNKFKDFKFDDAGPAFYASLTDDGTTPIFRLYNTKTGVHLYTRGEADREHILNKFKDFKFDDAGPAFYASLTDDGTTPIFRLYNKRTGVHLYTRGEADREHILNKFKDFKFDDAGPAFYLRTN